MHISINRSRIAVNKKLENRLKYHGIKIRYNSDTSKMVFINCDDGNIVDGFALTNPAILKTYGSSLYGTYVVKEISDGVFETLDKVNLDETINHEFRAKFGRSNNVNITGDIDGLFDKSGYYVAAKSSDGVIFFKSSSDGYASNGTPKSCKFCISKNIRARIGEVYYVKYDGVYDVFMCSTNLSKLNSCDYANYSKKLKWFGKEGTNISKNHTEKMCKLLNTFS